MPFNCKAQFTALLRRAGISYTPIRETIFVKEIYVRFNDDLDYVTYGSASDLRFTMSVPYSSPDTLLNKLYEYRALLRKCAPGYQFCVN